MIYEDPHREFCRRQHRMIGQYVAIQAWIRGLDCIVLERHDLEAFLGLQRFKSVRVEWLQSDLEPWFPHQQVFYRSSSPSSIYSLYLSRVPVADYLPDGTMTDRKRINRMSPSSPKTATFSKSQDKSDAPSLEDMVAELALLSDGLLDPQRKTRRRKRS